MKPIKYHIIGIGLLAAASPAFTGCNTAKAPIAQFEDITAVAASKDFESKNFLPEIKPDDELVIQVTSEDPAATAYYNAPFANPATRDKLSEGTAPRQSTYVVDSKGDITMPVIGSLHVGGLNVEQIAGLVESHVSKNVQDPLVTVTLLNFNVTVGGEVKQPKNIKVTRSRFTVLDALAEAGDITQYGRRDNVLVVREDKNGQKHSRALDLTKSDVFDSPYYYLTPNDYIYVTPNKILQDNSRYNQNNAFKLSVVSTIVSATSVIASLVIALTVK